MPFTVITLRKVPPSLRGDLSKWMQEIATGVYVGNFNVRIRENLWNRVCDAVGDGEATISYMCQNEIGYDFRTLNAKRKVIDCDGIPLVLLPLSENEQMTEKTKEGFSNAYKIRQAQKYAPSHTKREAKKSSDLYVVVDIETTGLNAAQDQILEIGAVKRMNEGELYFHNIIRIDSSVPQNIEKLTGITDSLVQKEGRELKEVLVHFLNFVRGCTLVGYNINFDVKFINTALEKCSLPGLQNRIYDLMHVVKQEKLFQKNYKLQTSLESYGIHRTVLHRALEDAKLIYELSRKLNKK